MRVTDCPAKAGEFGGLNTGCNDPGLPPEARCAAHLREICVSGRVIADRMSLVGRRGIHPQRAILLEVAKLPRRGVVKGDAHRRQPQREVDLPPDELLYRDRAGAACVQELQITREALSVA